MRWCEENDVDYVHGLACNARRVRAIGAELQVAAAEALLTPPPARRFRELTYRTQENWSRSRRVMAKAEHTGDKSNPRFIVTSFSQRQWATRAFYKDFYCACGKCENRIE